MGSPAIQSGLVAFLLKPCIYLKCARGKGVLPVQETSWWMRTSMSG